MGKKLKLPPQCIILSDTHIGCSVGLCDCSGGKLDSGNIVEVNAVQEEIHRHWKYMWNVWVPAVTDGQPYYVIHNGDAMDGRHHGSTTQWTQNLNDQNRHAVLVLSKAFSKATHYFHIRGTEAHSGQAGEEEEKLARALGATPNSAGNYARYDLWSMVGKGLIHVAHHIGSTSSQAYASSAPMRELMEEYVWASKMGLRAPDAIVRSHRHQYIEVKGSSHKGRAFAIVTPSWQAKTPFAQKVARVSVPEVGAIFLKWNKSEGLYSRAYVEPLARSDTEVSSETRTAVLDRIRYEIES